MKALDLYEIIGIKTPFEKWLKSQGVGENLSMSEVCTLVGKCRNKEAKKWLEEEIARREAELKALKTVELPAMTEDDGWFMKGTEPFVTSLESAKALEMNHKDVLRAVAKEIKSIEDDLNLLKSGGRNYTLTDSDTAITALSVSLEGFTRTTYTSCQNKALPMFILSEQAALAVAMRKSASYRSIIAYKFLSMRDVIIKYINLGNILVQDKTLRPIPRRLYLMWSEDEAGRMWTKVGISTDPEARAKSLNTGSIHPVTLCWQSSVASNVCEVESAVHKELEEAGCERRGEWFSVEPEVALESIKKHALRLAGDDE